MALPRRCCRRRGEPALHADGRPGFDRPARDGWSSPSRPRMKWPPVATSLSPLRSRRRGRAGVHHALRSARPGPAPLPSQLRRTSRADRGAKQSVSGNRGASGRSAGCGDSFRTRVSRSVSSISSLGTGCISSTDGLFEISNPAGEIFGKVRLASTLSGLRGASLEDSVIQTLDTARSWTRGKSWRMMSPCWVPR